MRNNFLAQSLAKNAASTSEAQTPAPLPETSGPGGPKALRSMATAIENLTSNAPQDLDPNQISDSLVEDRIDTLEGLDSLIESIKSSGQKLPILVRHRKASSGPIYEVVYGRRRLAASRALGIKVKAFVREMDQTEALMSQALENSARLDRSFIEQALFAHRLHDAGLTADQIIEGLAINTTLYKRLMAVSKAIPAELILAIGAAHDAGRRPWLELKDLIKTNEDLSLDALIAMVDTTLPTSDRLTHLISSLKDHEAKKRAQSLQEVLASPEPQSSVLKAPPAETGARTVKDVFTHSTEFVHQSKIDAPSESAPRKLGSISVQSGHKRVILSAGHKQDRAFFDYLEKRLEDLYAEWAKSSQK